jgi:hypothetical protein
MVSLKRMSQSVNIISWSEYKISQMWWLNPGRRMIQEAKQLGMKTRLHDGIYGGDISNSSLIPQLDYVDMDALVLKPKICRNYARIWKTIYSEHNGTGVIL